MANHLHRILVVASNGSVVERVLRSVGGQEIEVRSDFESARLELDRHPPDLLVAQVRLGAFNGLHLAIRARGRGLPTRTILIGEPDVVLENEAREQHARYLTWPVDVETLAATIQDTLSEADAALNGAALVAAGGTHGTALAAAV
jgi:DNA-binding response OmpR family regulator